MPPRHALARGPRRGHAARRARQVRRAPPRSRAAAAASLASARMFRRRHAGCGASGNARAPCVPARRLLASWRRRRRRARSGSLRRCAAQHHGPLDRPTTRQVAVGGRHTRAKPSRPENVSETSSRRAAASSAAAPIGFPSGDVSTPFAFCRRRRSDAVPRAPPHPSKYFNRCTWAPRARQRTNR
jgi:hypothetical protein